jgi:trimeric autotransporter adhesin
MINLRSLPLCVLAGAFLCALLSEAQQPAPAVRIVNPIDESQRITLTHTVSPLANAANDRGAAPDGMQLDRLQLVLQRSPAQETALRQLIAEQNQPGAPSYHQWLTPDQFGAQFGASDQDIATIESWLGSHGFAVSKVNAGKGTLEFSGSVAQLRNAFHTQIHKYVVNGETHYANANDPQIPAALAPVIGGFTSLNNFRPKSNLQKIGETTYNPATGRAKSLWTIGSGTFDYQSYNFVISPGDFAVQYDLNPLYSQGINGSGQTIAIINDSNINIDLVNQFRTLFGLPANPPQVIVDGNDPGVDGINNPDGPNYSSSEAYLDVEWSGAVAPNATVNLVIAADTALESGLILAAEHAVYGNIAPVLSLSFGNCEFFLGASNAFINDLWEQAAAQGQTVMVSTGDDGAAGCDDGTDYAVNGQAVNGFASTPYDVAVGGTDFQYSSYSQGDSAIDSQLATYWNTTASNSTPTVSIKGYIPEQPWNDSQFGLDLFNEYTDQGETDTNTVGGGGGASNAALCSNNTYSASTGECTGTPSGYPKPSWQSGTGVPSDSVRDLPDVSLFSANGYNDSYYAICATDADCQPATSGGLVQIYGVGGTSASAPSFAGIMALVNQKYGRQGQADTVLYPLAKQFPSAFHDIIVGNNSVPCAYSATAADDSPDCIQISANSTLYYKDIDDQTYGTANEGQIGSGSTVEYNATTGYDLASGLGSVDATQLVTNWGNVKFASSSTTMTVTPPSGVSLTSIPHGTALTISGTVTGSSPTGNVALMTNSTEPGQQGSGFANVLNGSPSTFALSSGSYTGSVSTLPGGTYNIWASYGGDNNNAGSNSAPPVSITVDPENSGIFFQAISPAGTLAAGSTASTTIPYGLQLELSAQVTPSSQLSAFETCTTSCPVFTIPAGTVTFTDGSTNINTAVLNAEGDAEYNSPFAIGTHAVTASYSGDSSYNKSTAAAINFTIGQDAPTLVLGTTLETNSNQAISGTGQQTILTIQLENSAQYGACNPNSSGTCSSGAMFPVPVAPPTGTITLAGSSLSALTGTLPVSPSVDPTTGASTGVVNIAIPANTASGNYNFTVSYSGDTNYTALAAQSETLPIENINSDGGLSSSITATMSGSISPNSEITVTGTVTGQSGKAAPTGGVYLFSSNAYLGEASFTSSTGDVSSFSTVLQSQGLIQGANYVVLQYSGDNTYNPSTFVLNNNSAIANPLADFTIVPQTTIVPVSSTSSGNDTLNLASVNGFSGAIALTCTSATPGLTCAPSPASVALTNGGSGTSGITISTTSAVADGNYSVLVTGTDPTGEFIHTASVEAVVTSSSAAFALSNSGNITVGQGATTNNTSTITATASSGFSGSVYLSCKVTSTPSSATSPATCSVPASLSLPGTTSGSLAVSTTSATTTGTYTVLVTGSAGSETSTTSVIVTVNAAAMPGFTLAASTPTAVNPGSSTSSTVTATATNGFAGSISFTCSLTSSPAGAVDVPSCTPSGTVTLPTSTQATMNIATTAASSADLVVPRVNSGKTWLGAGGGALLALLVFLGIPARRRSWRSMLSILVALVVLGAMASCGGGGSSSGGGGGGGGGGGTPGTTAGSYTFTVTGSNTSVSPSPSTSFTFTVN